MIKGQIKKAVILAGGLNSRVMPFSKVIPKVMLPVGDKLVIQYLLEECRNSGIKDVILVVRDQYSIIKKFLEPDKRLNKLLRNSGKGEVISKLRKIEELCRVRYVVQKVPRGEADAFAHAKKYLRNENVAVILGDTVYRSEAPAICQVADKLDESKSVIVGNARIVMTKKGLAEFEDKFKRKAGFSDLRLMDIYSLDEQKIVCVEGSKIEVGSLREFCSLIKY